MSTTSNPAQWLIDWFRGGEPTDAGVAVNYTSALSYAYVWACVSMISRDVAAKALNVYAVDANGDRAIDLQSPIQWLLNGRPNDHMTAFTFREVLTSHALLWGNGYAFIRRDGAMRPQSLHVLLPDSVDVRVDEDDRLWYEYTPRRNGNRRNTKTEIFPARDVLHIHGLGWDGLSGHSVISLARNSWGLGIAAQKHGSKVFASGARPSVVLETDSRLDKETAEMLLAKWEERHANEYKPALLSHGIRLNPFSMTNDDSQWIESRQFQRVEVAVWFGVPPHKLGDSSKIAYNSIESEERAYINQTLSSWLGRWETECQSKLLAERVQRNFSQVIKHDTADIPSSDIETRTEIITKLRAAEVINQNEGRKMIGLAPVDGGEEFANPNVRSAATGSSEQTREADDQSSLEIGAEAKLKQRRLFETILSRIISMEQKRAADAAAKQKNFCEWVDTFYSPDGFVATKTREMVAPVLDAYTSLPGVECSVTVADIACAHIDQSKNGLLEVAGYSDAGSLANNVTEAVSAWDARATATASFIVGE